MSGLAGGRNGDSREGSETGGGEGMQIAGNETGVPGGGGGGGGGQAGGAC